MAVEGELEGSHRSAVQEQHHREGSNGILRCHASAAAEGSSQAAGHVLAPPMENDWGCLST